jgi:hypothetical protein
MSALVSIKEWEAIWYECFQLTLGNLKSYKRRLKELENEGKTSNELIGKKLALKALIDYPV